MQASDTIPDPEAFRAWLRDALDATGTRPTPLSLQLGLGKNTLREFLTGQPGRDIGLRVACTVSRHLQGLAADAGKTLPPMKRAA